MTLPEQSERAVAATREFLVRLASPYGEGAIKGIRREVRAEASRLLRHYPYAWDGDCPEPDNVARQDILTDEERAAVCWAAALEPAPNGRWTKSDDETWNKRAATLRGMLERTK
jgi:hypothetical protein